jgi:hypothetical protein
VDKQEFFDLIWGQGVRLVVAKNSKGQFRAITCKNNAHAAATVTGIEDRGHAVYHACATFKTPDSRKAENVQEVKAYWLDVDVGDTKAYGDQPTALAALSDYVESVGLPTPYIVSSGKGLHVYWPLDEAVSPEDWLYTAQALKASIKSHGLKADPTRTADIASILRPVGSTNDKYGTPVKLLRRGEITTQVRMRKVVEAHVVTEQSSVLNLGEKPAHLSGLKVSDMSEALDQDRKPGIIEDIIVECGAMRSFQQSEGRVSEPAWYHALGVLLNCEDGERLCHEWSSGHPEYSQRQTQRKINQLKEVGPTTCATMSDHYDACKGCPLKERITSPIQIGKKVAASVESVEHDGEEIELPKLPNGYRVGRRDGGVGIFAHGFDPSEPDIKITDRLLYVESFFTDPNGEKFMSVVERREDNKVERLDLPFRELSGRGDWMSRMLGVGMMVNDANMKGVKRYMQAWTSMQGSKDFENTEGFTSYGWKKGKGFVLGGHLYGFDGSKREVHRSQTMQIEGVGLGPQGGDVERWSEIIDTLFNQPSMEHIQFTILCSFASPLLALSGDKGGTIVYAHSDTSGTGKTTADNAALSVWGTWRDRTRTVNSTTDNAFQSFMSTMCSLPVIYDEMTNYAPDKVSQFIHTISSGQPRARMTRTGEAQYRPGHWDMVVCSSGNVLLSDKLAGVKGNSGPELARVFEYTFPELKSNLKLSEATNLMQELEDHVGVAGELYIQYLLKHYKDLKPLMDKVRSRLEAEINFSGPDRFRARLMVAVLTANIITNKLKLTDFEPRAIKRWMLGKTEAMQEVSRITSSDTVSKFDEMLQDLMADALVTTAPTKAGTGANVVQQPRSKLTMWTQIPNAMDRAGSQDTETYILKTAMRKWAMDRNESLQFLIESWVRDGLIEDYEYRSMPYGDGIAQFQGRKGTFYKQIIPASGANLKHSGLTTPNTVLK